MVEHFTAAFAAVFLSNVVTAGALMPPGAQEDSHAGL